MIHQLGPNGRLAALLALGAGLTTVVAGLLFIGDVSGLPTEVAADAWRTATGGGGLDRGGHRRHRPPPAGAHRADGPPRPRRSTRRAREREARQRGARAGPGHGRLDGRRRHLRRRRGPHRARQQGRAGPAGTSRRGRACRSYDCHPKASQAVLDRVMRYLRSGDDAGPAHSIIKEKEGRYETTYAPVTDAGGAYLGTVMVIRDIAERRHLENRLLDAERLSGLGQMSAQIAHELRNPLNAIDGRGPVPGAAAHRPAGRDGVRRAHRRGGAAGQPLRGRPAQGGPAGRAGAGPHRGQPAAPRGRPAGRPGARPGGRRGDPRPLPRGAAARPRRRHRRRRGGQPGAERHRRRRRRARDRQPLPDAAAARARWWWRCATAAAASRRTSSRR